MNKDEIIDGLNQSGVPEHMHDGVVNYLVHGIPGGGFLTAIFENDFMSAVAKADHINIDCLSNYARFLYNHAPPESYGSRENVETWIKRKGWRND